MPDSVPLHPLATMLLLRAGCPQCTGYVCFVTNTTYTGDVNLLPSTTGGFQLKETRSTVKDGQAIKLMSAYNQWGRPSRRHNPTQTKLNKPSTDGSVNQSRAEPTMTITNRSCSSINLVRELIPPVLLRNTFTKDRKVDIRFEADWRVCLPACLRLMSIAESIG